MKRLVVTALAISLLALPVVGSPAAAGQPRCNGVRATIVGNDKANVIKGTAGRDVIVAKGGKDRIHGRGGRDLICAGDGADVVFSGAGKDKVFGGAGNDTLKGGAAWDLLVGGPGKDACYVNDGGGKTVACEEADLSVAIVAPATVKPGVANPFKVAVLVKNIGARHAAGVVLKVAWDETNVTCADDFSDELPKGTIRAGLLKGEIYTQYCQAPAGTPATVSITASATTTSAEAFLDNNAAAAQITVESP